MARGRRCHPVLTPRNRPWLPPRIRACKSARLKIGIAKIQHNP